MKKLLIASLAIASLAVPLAIAHASSPDTDFLGTCTFSTVNDPINCTNVLSQAWSPIGGPYTPVLGFVAAFISLPLLLWKRKDTYTFTEHAPTVACAEKEPSAPVITGDPDVCTNAANGRSSPTDVLATLVINVGKVVQRGCDFAQGAIPTVA